MRSLQAQKYLTVVVDHDRAGWCGPIPAVTRHRAGFFDALKASSAGRARRSPMSARSEQWIADVVRKRCPRRSAATTRFTSSVGPLRHRMRAREAWSNARRTATRRTVRPWPTRHRVYRASTRTARAGMRRPPKGCVPPLTEVLGPGRPPSHGRQLLMTTTQRMHPTPDRSARSRSASLPRPSTTDHRPVEGRLSPGPAYWA